MITATPEGIVLDVRVIPRAGRSGLAGTRAGFLLVRLAAAPVEGAANTELVAILSRTLGVPKRAVTIVSGAHSRGKRVAVAGVSPEEAARLLADT